MIVDTAPCSGNVGELKSVVPVHILVEKTPTGLRVPSSRIFFKEFRADYQDVRSDLPEKNMKRLAHMASKPKKFPTLASSLVASRCSRETVLDQSGGGNGDQFVHSQCRRIPLHPFLFVVTFLFVETLLWEASDRRL